LRGRHFYTDGLVVFLLALWFLFWGLAAIPYPGIQQDEALFTSAIYEPKTTANTVQVFGRPVSLMLMSYLGTLKAWIYVPVLRFWDPSAYSLRVPVLLLGAITIFFFYILLRRIADRATALAGSALLATDGTYLYTSCFDWGPVVLQHLLSVTGVLALVQFHRTGRQRWLAGGFFLFGLALWDKALFGWALIGMGAAALCVFPRIILKYFRFNYLLIASVCFAIGAFPLLRYNVRSKGATLRASQGWSTDRQMILGKFTILQRSFEGAGLNGYISVEDPSPQARAPRTQLEKLAADLDNRTGRRRASLMWYAFLGAILLLPWVWGTKARAPLLFSFIVCALMWLQMLFGVGVGGSVHHVALLWPWPQLLVAAALTGITSRLKGAGIPVLAVAVFLLCTRNFLSSNAFYSQLARNGGATVWSDAIYELCEYLPATGAKQYLLLDWGMTDNLRFLSRGKMPLAWAADPILGDQFHEQKQQEFRGFLDTENAVFVSHTAGYEVFAEVNRRRDQALAELGYRRQILRVISDSHGRPVFEVFRAAAGHQPSAAATTATSPGARAGVSPNPL